MQQGAPGNALQNAGGNRRRDQTAVPDNEQTAPRPFADRAVAVQDDAAVGANALGL